MTQKSILMTGCSSGIGYDAAHRLAKRGWRVFATCRQETDCARLRAEGLESFQLDHTDADSIKAAVTEATTRTGGTLDAVFANGAYGLPAAAEDLPTEALRHIFETNFFGVHELTRTVLPILRAQGHGRIIMCSSVLGIATMRWRSAYAATKFALEGYTDTLRIEMAPENIQCVLIEPGPITTQFRQNARAPFERWIDWKNSPRKAFYESEVIPRLYADNTKKDPFELGPEAVTKKLIHALDSAHPRARYRVTGVTHIAAFLVRFAPNRLLDWIIARI
ncbi:MAG: SDR family NAD(P)-dependent oxidoreductase [Maritimibacter sp.]